MTDQLGLGPIHSVQSQDFRLVLKDADRAFRVTSSELTAPSGGSVTLGYEGAKLSPSGSEFISAILMDAAGTTPLYYGKIAVVQSESGSINVELPSGLADGTYLLKVFNEQYNGPKKSGTASPFCDVTLKIDPSHIAAPIDQVNLTLTAPVTGKTPRAAVTEDTRCTVTSTTWAPENAVFQPNTDYRVSLVLKANAGYTFTKDTVFTLNGETVVPVADGETYVIHYDAFPTTEGDNSGWQHNGAGWWYNDTNGNYVTGWQHIGSYWYYFAADGYMQTGWQHLGRYWYYIAPEGNMLTGWQHIGSYWYYFAPEGNMQTGWHWIDGKCYYFHENGNMAANEWIGGSYVDGSGAWVQ